VSLSPVVIDLFGSKRLAVLAIAGVPFVIGVLSLLGTIFRVVTNPFSKNK